MINNSNEIHSRIERKEDIIEEKIQRIKEEDLLERRVYSSLSKHERSLGVYYLAVRNRQEAKHWFGESTEHNLVATVKYREYSQERGFPTWENEALKLRDCVYTGLLSQNQTCLDRTIDEVENIPEEYVSDYAETRPWYDFTHAVASLLQEAYDQFEIYLENLRTHADVFNERIALRYRGFADILEGITVDNSELIESGIEDALVDHRESSNPDSTKASDLVCVPAAAMYVLVLMYGFDPSVDSPYLPTALDEEYVELGY